MVLRWILGRATLTSDFPKIGPKNRPILKGPIPTSDSYSHFQIPNALSMDPENGVKSITKIGSKPTRSVTRLVTKVFCFGYHFNKAYPIAEDSATLIPEGHGKFIREIL